MARDDALDRAAGALANGAQRRELRVRLSERLMKIALESVSGESARLWHIGRNASGRPVVLRAPPAAPRLEVGLAHSGAFLAAAASGCEAVAVDVEIVRGRRFADLARQLHWPSTLRAARLTADRFYQLWTLWEATLKLPAGPGERQRALFAGLARALEPGVPGTAAAAGCFAQSWLCPDQFWVTVISCCPRAPQIRLLAVEAWGRRGEAPRLAELEACATLIDPPPAPPVDRTRPLC